MAEFLDLEACVSESCSDVDNEDYENLEVLECISGGFIDNEEVSDEDIPPNPYLSSQSGSEKRSLDGHGDSPEKKRNCNAPAIHWCFTVFQYDEETEKKLKSLYPDTVDYLCYGHEVCPTTGKAHLQGYIKFTNKKRFNQVKKLFNVPPHIEKCKGTPHQNFIYCGKEDKNPVELGTRPFKTPEIKQQKMQLLIDQLISGVSVTEICKSNLCHIFVTNRDKIMRTVHEIKMENERKTYQERPMGSLSSLRQWQQDLMKFLHEIKNNDRSIVWVYDSKGNSGKTWLCREMCMTMNSCIVLQNGHTRDVAHLYNGERWVFFDFSRSDKNFINYDVLEKIKDGIIISTKYEGRCKLFHSPTVCCFANFFPKVENLSEDRWEIFQLEAHKLVQRNYDDFVGLS
jgi:hypothetical protein